jgi:hypothetical protein
MYLFDSDNCCRAGRLQSPLFYTCVYAIPYLLGEQKKMNNRLPTSVVSGLSDPLLWNVLSFVLIQKKEPKKRSKREKKWLKISPRS